MKAMAPVGTRSCVATKRSAMSWSINPGLDPNSSTSAWCEGVGSLRDDLGTLRIRGPTRNLAGAPVVTRWRRLPRRASRTPRGVVPGGCCTGRHTGHEASGLASGSPEGRELRGRRSPFRRRGSSGPRPPSVRSRRRSASIAAARSSADRADAGRGTADALSQQRPGVGPGSGQGLGRVVQHLACAADEPIGGSSARGEVDDDEGVGGAERW